MLPEIRITGHAVAALVQQCLQQWWGDVGLGGGGGAGGGGGTGLHPLERSLLGSQEVGHGTICQTHSHMNG